MHASYAVLGRNTGESSSIRPQSIGGLSFIGTLLVMSFAAFMLGGFNVLAADVVPFFTVQLQRHYSASYYEMLGPIFAITVLDIAIVFALMGVLSKYITVKGEHSVEGMLSPKKEEKLFKRVYLIVVLEEFSARLLFLGIFYKLPVFHNPVGFYTLFLVGNTLWALVHLGNFKSKEDRSPLLVLPQFIGGVSLTYIFMKYGFFPAFIAHFVYNCVLFAASKRQETNWVDFKLIQLGAVYMVIGWLLLDRPLSDTMTWFAPHSSFVLEGWGFRQYFALLLLLDGASDVLFGLLCYDRSGLEGMHELRKELEKNGRTFFSVEFWGLYAVAALAFGAVITLAVWLINGALTDVGIADVVTRIFLVASILCFCAHGRSGSSIARVFFERVIEIMVVCAVVFALGGLAAVCFVAVYLLVTGPRQVLMSYDT